MACRLGHHVMSSTFWTGTQHIITYLGVGMGYPKWMAYDGKSYKSWWFGGTPILGNPHIHGASYLLACFYRFPVACAPIDTSDLDSFSWNHSTTLIQPPSERDGIYTCIITKIYRFLKNAIHIMSNYIHVCPRWLERKKTLRRPE